MSTIPIPPRRPIPAQVAIPGATEPAAPAPVQETIAAVTEQAQAPVESTTSVEGTDAGAAAAPLKLSPPAKKVVKPAKAAKAPAAKPPKAVATKRAMPAKKAAPVKKAAAAKPSPKPATENVVPKVPKVKTRIWSDEAVELCSIVVGMKQITPAFGKERVELRGVPERLQAIMNEKIGLRCLKVYSNAEEVGKMVKFFQRIPEEFIPAKWLRAFPRIEKVLAK